MVIQISSDLQHIVTHLWDSHGISLDRQYLDGKMVANVLSNAQNALFDPLLLLKSKIKIFQGNVTVDDYSKGNVVILLFL